MSIAVDIEPISGSVSLDKRDGRYSSFTGATEFEWPAIIGSESAIALQGVTMSSLPTFYEGCNTLSFAIGGPPLPVYETIPVGYYTPAEAVLAMQVACDALATTYPELLGLTVNYDPVTHAFSFSAAVGFIIGPSKLMETLGFIPGGFPQTVWPSPGRVDFRFTRYIDIVSEDVSRNTNAADADTHNTNLDVIGRVYLTEPIGSSEGISRVFRHPKRLLYKQLGNCTIRFLDDRGYELRNIDFTLEFSTSR